MPTQTQNKTSILRKTVILWWDCVTIVDMEKLYTVWVCVSILISPECKAHATCYIIICSVSGCTALFHIIS